MSGWKTARLIGYGFLLGTAGVKILSSKVAKKVYTHVTAAALRGTDEVVKCAVRIRENCDDIVADAKEINEKQKIEEREREIQHAKEVLAAEEEN